MAVSRAPGSLRDLQLALQLKVEELRQRDALIDELELELDSKDDLIRQLQVELDRYRSTARRGGQDAETRRTKRHAFSAEAPPLDSAQLAAVSITSYRKSKESRDLIQKALLDNDYMKHLEREQIASIVDSMYPTSLDKGSCVTQEGDVGSTLYVLEEGRVEVTKQGRKRSNISGGKVFGELAVLQRCACTATVTALTNVRLWAMDRQGFQTVTMRAGLLRRSRHTDLLRRVPWFQSLPDGVLCRLAEALEETVYSDGDFIIRQGAPGDTFFIVSEGQVKASQQASADGERETEWTLSEGDWFGEHALKGEDVRAASVMAVGGATCLVIDRESFKRVVGGPDGGPDGAPDGGDVGSDGGAEVEFRQRVESDFISGLSLGHFRIISTLGRGGCSRVDLVGRAHVQVRLCEVGVHVELQGFCLQVQLEKYPNRSFALKVLQRSRILQTGQQNRVRSERRILMEAHNPFIVRLYRTFRDSRRLYMLLEACLGGDLWSLLQDRGPFDDGATRFYAGCVTEALVYLHHKGIIYRNLKPETILLDLRGYAKLVDFGFAKYVGVGKKTWTFCGTPEYVAPEILLNKGHDGSVDCWALGVLLFELLCGSPPFLASDPLDIYNIILRGIDMIQFPRKITKSAANLIKGLCRDRPSERLGNQKNGLRDVQKHKWFDGFDWDGLQQGSIRPPFAPPADGPLVHSDFDSFTEDTDEPPPDDGSGWDAEF